MLHSSFGTAGESMASVANYVQNWRPARAPLARRRVDDAVIRVADLGLALGLIAFLAPLFLLAAAFCLAQADGPVLYGQMRLGRGAKLFRCYKFRSMVVDSDNRLAKLLESSPVARAEWGRDQKLRNDPRITKWGRFMRKTSIDELPQLFNVLRGEMSLVGPRPIVAAEIERYGHYITQYYSVTPGLTGLWQVSGRNQTSYRRRVALDIVYARSRSLGLYMRILLATIPAVLFSDGAF